VANRREQPAEATCITEMSVMMACWKQNDFSDTACAEEIRMFYDCVAKAE
ncbi:CHCH1 protein, partial [Ptilonorhynchus violaceus]|nr:CHCH1 protein [Ptilonorhynchus violaceus]